MFTFSQVKLQQVVCQPVKKKQEVVVFLDNFIYFVVLNVESRPLLSTSGLQNQPAAYQQRNH